MEELEIMEQRTIPASPAAGSGVSNDIQLFDHVDIEEDGNSSDEEYHRIPPEYAQYHEEWGRGRGPSSNLDYEDDEDDEDDELPADTPEMQPVRAFIPLEIWLEIFAVSMPMWLARARRVSKAFKSLIDSEKIWRQSRQHWFPEYPAPEFGLTEMQMWELRLTTNCTVCGAKRKNNLVLFWQFKVKCCRSCLREKFIPYHRLLQRKNFKMEWKDYLVYGYFEPATHYYRTEFGWHTYLLEDVKSLEAKMKTPKGRAWVKINADMLTEKALIALEISDELEMFESEVKNEIMEENYRLQVERDEEIVKRCSFLSPPLEKKVLRHICAYSVAISIPRPFTDKSWNTLREKLEAGRGEAEEIVRKEEEEQKRQKQLLEEEIAMLEELLYIWEPTKSRLEEYVDEFLSKNGGVVNKGFEGTFAIQALRYARKKWSEIEEYKGKQLPLGMIPHLIRTKLARVCNGQANIFSCVLCGKSKTFTIEGLLSHLLSPRHKSDKKLESAMKLVDGFPLKSSRSSMGFYPAVIIAERCHNIQWLDSFPMCALGPVFKPLSEQKSPDPSPHTTQQLERSSLTEVHYGQKSVPAIEASPLSLRRIRNTMDKELFRTTNPRMPIPIRLFLWFRLSTNSYIREHGSLPDIMGFVTAASTLRQDKINEIFGTLKCGACSIWYNRSKDGDKQSFNWGTLGEHFVSGHRKLRRNWSEKLVKVPTAQEVIAAMVGMEVGMKERLIELLLEADSKLTLEVLNLEGQNTGIFEEENNGNDADVESSCV